MSKNYSYGEFRSVPTVPVIALTVNQVCQRLQLSRPSVMMLIQTGRLYAIKVGRTWRVSELSLERLLVPPTGGDR